MRMDEITINIPITIDLDGVKPRVNVAGTPQQQELELKKAELGKNSPVIDKMIDDEDVGAEDDTDQPDNIKNLRTLAGLTR